MHKEEVVAQSKEANKEQETPSAAEARGILPQGNIWRRNLGAKKVIAEHDRKLP